MFKIGVIGGSGVYELEQIKNIEEITVNTPFGPPSDTIVKGELFDKEVYFLARHGKGHRIPPSDINYRANIYAMKSLGVERIFSVTAVGSMKEEIQPGDMVVVTQFIDRTNGRISSFFTENIVAHVAFADPVCLDFAQILYNSSKKIYDRTHNNATYICINGPQFSTRAESKLYRTWGVDVIGMTNVTEAKLAREAGICYATLALATDYDCWRENDTVNAYDIIEIIKQNVENAKKIISETIKNIPNSRECLCKQSLANALMTEKSKIPYDTYNNLKIILEQ
jgi:5'-methylthioadenosine phosphorylase